ncbi:uncharacterized protein LOC132124900 isoform X2 [Carassius carassius]|uniref:uncharacterized protein LOC132124900 isoform X2 n=1 Tax=Carassius carassius TaxID=217509 RepID=UPI002868C748|nr:uncharacterized protein LOC132124900 isoform X2 [Carassius carassius]
MSGDAKKFTSFDKGINLVSKPSDLDEYDDDPDVLRAVLSCGHITDPETLTDCCRAQMDDGKTEFKCPLCEKKWPYDEVRKLAKLSDDETLIFEDKVGTNTVKKLVDFRGCPGCGTFVERLDVSNLCVKCSVCTERTRKSYHFCWQCLREWKGPGPRADRCDNVGCAIDQKLLKDCPLITLTSVQNVQCPAIRACTSCGVLTEHNNKGHKIIECHACNNRFCFICLKPADECIKSATHYIKCTAGVAPRQAD